MASDRWMFTACRHGYSLRSIVSTSILVALTTWCSTVAVAEYDAVDEDTRLAQLAERFFRWRLEESPEFGTLFGIHDHDDRVEEYSEVAFQQQVENATSFLAETETVDRRKLSSKSHVTLDTLIYNLRTFIDGYQYRRYGMYNPITPLERPTGEWTGIVSYMKFAKETDYQKFLSRLRLLPLQIQQLIAMMRRAIENGITVHEVSLTGALQSIDELIVDNSTVESSSMFQTAFRSVPTNIPKSTKSSLIAETKELLLGSVNEAWIRLRNFVNDEYMQHTRPNVSVSSLPGGLDYYEACLRWHTTTNMTSAEIFQIGLDEVNRIGSEMRKIMLAEGFSGSIREFVVKLYNDSSNFYNTSDEVLRAYEAILARVHKQLPRVLLKNPQIPVVVRRSSNPQAPAGSYQDPPLDVSRPGEFIANVHYPRSVLKASMTALTLHEAEPGHHTQAAYGLRSNIPLFRRAIEFRKYHSVPFNWPFFTAYVEGWALYAESLGEEMNIYNDRLTLFGRYTSEMFRACRLVVDTGIHAFGWSKEQAVSFFVNNTAESSVMIDIEVNRYISWPGQACAYKIGELTIQRLKKKATAKLGSRFDRRAFNDLVLDLGAVPLSVLETHVDRWIDDVIVNSGAHTTKCLDLMMMLCSLAVVTAAVILRLADVSTTVN